MVFGMFFFFILFAFLLFVFFVYLTSIFMKRSFPNFEPGISVIIPAYNEESNIRSCLESVFASNYPKNKLEVIVVDDGSTDKTVEIVEQFSNVKLLKQNHLGKSNALTYGTKKSNNDYVLCIDADTIISSDCIKEIVKPLFNPKIAAATGVSTVRNTNSLLGKFQTIEYHYNNLIRHSFSVVFNNGIWFFGALSCYKKKVLKEIGYFKSDTLTEDMDIALEIKNAGYKTYSVKNAVGATIVPTTLAAFYKQRSRWWMGVLQSLVKNKKLFTTKSSPAILFLYVNQFWWSFYAFLSLPLIIYQIYYWLPYNTATSLDLFGYLFRWFTLSGPFYVIYKIPVWGISFYGFFGVLSGIISTIMIVASIYLYKDKLRISNMMAIFFYFPYTILLNLVIFISVLHFRWFKTKYFLK